MEVERERLDGLRPLPLEGARGEGWVVGQALLLLIYLLAPRSAATWPRRLPPLAGLPALLLGAGLLAWGSGALGRLLTPLPRPAATGQVIDRGPYRHLRHPIYAGVTLGALGLALLTRHDRRLLVTAALALFFDAKARREERWLLTHYPEYRVYRERVRRFVPGLY